jgi:hypothetical protein
MRLSIIILLLWFPCAALSQTLESFEDGDFLQNPTWTGDSSYFYINSQKQLQSNGPSSTTSIYLSFPSCQAKETVWQFWVKLPFQPSTSNFAKVFITSDLPNLKGSLHGYYIKIGGESGTTDGIDFYKQTGNTSIKLIDGISGHAGKSNNELRIKVERDGLGNWSLYSDTTGGFNFSLEGAVFDTSYNQCSYSGIVYAHTSTRRTQFFFDDFIISPTPLKVVKIETVNSNEVKLEFNRSVDSSLLDSSFYSIEKIGHPSRCDLSDAGHSLILKFGNEFRKGSHLLYINSFKNTVLIIQQTISFYFKNPLPYGALVISEIFPDPTPSQGLPEQEYIEIYNSTNDTIDLNSFIFSDPETQSILPDSTLPPKSYCVLTSKEGAYLFHSYGSVIGLNPWPSLNNDSDQLVIKDDKGRVIHKVDYSKTWFTKNKLDGGWSLEMINYKELCKEKYNWGSSINDEGGTPGIVNSISTNEEDKEGPRVVGYTIFDSITLDLRFDEPLDSTIDQRIFTIKDHPIQNLQLISSSSIRIFLQKEIYPNSEILVKIHQVKDCVGNNSNDTTLVCIEPEEADSLDLIINEILFNPKPGGYDFVEFYNRSGKILNLQNWKIQSVKNNKSIVEKVISSDPVFVKPTEYRATTYSLNSLKNEYFVRDPNSVIELDLPTFNDEEGTVRIVNSKGKIIDEFTYRDKLQSPLLKSHEGVSLERISFFAGTNVGANWYSASSSVGFATPGYENSQFLKEDRPNKEFSIDPAIISPNADNHNDLSFFNFQFKDPGNSITIKIFSIDGKLIKTIAQNQLAGTEGFYFWDGTDQTGALIEAGIYIVWVDFFNPSGSHSTLKNTITVATDF